MHQSYSAKARTSAAIIAVAVFASLALQTAINAQPAISRVETFGLMLRYFTIWTNFAAGLILGWIAIRGDAEPRVPFGLATAIVIVAAVYHLLLSAQHHPQGLDWWTNLMFHTLIPAATVIWWLACARLSRLSWRSLPAVMLVPVIYTIFALGYGALSGFYPYFFLDLPALGWMQLSANIAGLSLLFLGVAAVLLSLRGALAKQFAA